MKATLFLLFFVGTLQAAGADDPSSQIRFVEIGQQAGVRHQHHTRRFKGPYSDVLGMLTSGGAASAQFAHLPNGTCDVAPALVTPARAVSRRSISLAMPERSAAVGN